MARQKTIAVTRSEMMKIEIRASELGVSVSTYCRSMIMQALRDPNAFAKICSHYRHPSGRKRTADGKPYNPHNRHEPLVARFSITIQDEPWEMVQRWARTENLPRSVAVRAIVGYALDHEQRIEAVATDAQIRETPVGAAYKCKVPQALVDRYASLAIGARLSKDALDNITGYAFASVEARQLRGTKDEQQTYNTKLFSAIETIGYLYFGIGSEVATLAERPHRPQGPMVDFVVVDKSGRGPMMTTRLGCEGMPVELMVSLVTSLALWLMIDRIEHGKGLL